MAIEIQKTLTVDAPADRVWKYMLKAENVVRHLPGAKLLEVTDERHFVAQMKVRVGTVSVTYKGDVEIAELDEEARRVLIQGKWKEKAGSGSAKMTIEGKVFEEDGATKVSFDGSADVVGKIVQFGRGMIDGVSEELFKQFADKVKAELESLPDEEEEESADDVPTVEGPAPTTTPAPAAASPPAPAEEEEEEEPSINALAILFKVIWKRILGFFRAIGDFFKRLFGGGI